MVNNTRASLFVLFSALSLTACGGGGGDEKSEPTTNNTNPPTTTPVANVAPVANAGTEMTVNEQTEVTLGGKGTDSDGTISSYQWTQTAGTSVTLQNSATASASFDAPMTTEQLALTFELVVTDNSGDTANDSVTVGVAPVNTLPTAVAGESQTVNEQTVATLSGSGTDHDGNIAGYQWHQVTGASVLITNPASALASFTAPTTSELVTLTFELIVTDNEGGTSKNSVDIFVHPVNEAPIANAGEDKEAQEATIVVLTVNADDSDGAISSVLWTQTAGTTVTLLDAHEPSATFTAPLVTQNETLTFDVVVTDNEDATTTDSVNVLIAKTASTVYNKLNDTGITQCNNYGFDENGNTTTPSNNLDCSVTIDSETDSVPTGQDGYYGRDVTHNDDSDGHAGFSYTKLDANGQPLDASATEWSCVQDNVSGLVWEVKTTDGGLQHNTNTYTWYNPNSTTNGGDAGTQNGGSCTGSDCDTHAYINSINEQGLCGANDWYLPTIEQLVSIIDYSVGQPNIGVDKNYFPNVVYKHLGTVWYSYWSSVTVSNSPERALGLDFDTAPGQYVQVRKDYVHTFVRAVRYGQ